MPLPGLAVPVAELPSVALGIIERYCRRLDKALHWLGELAGRGAAGRRRMGAATRLVSAAWRLLRIPDAVPQR